MPDPIIQEPTDFGVMIPKAWAWLRGQISPTDLGQGLAVRGPETWGKQIINAAAGAPMALSDLNDAVGQPFTQVAQNAVHLMPAASVALGFTSLDEARQQAQARLQQQQQEQQTQAQQEEAKKALAMHHLQLAFQSGDAVLGPDGQPVYKSLEAWQNAQFKIAQDFQNRFQAPPAVPPTSQRIGAAATTLTGGLPHGLEDLQQAWTTGQPQVDPAVANDTTGWVKPQTALGSVADQVYPIVNQILMGKASMGDANSGLEGLGRMGTAQAAFTYPQAYLQARQNPEVTASTAHDVATTRAALMGVLPLLGVTRAGVPAFAAGAEKLGLNPAVASFLASQGLTAGEAGLMTYGEGKANQYLDPNASAFSGTDFLKNLAMMEGTGAVTGGYEALKAKSAGEAQEMQFGQDGKPVQYTNRPALLEDLFQSLQGKRQGEQLAQTDWLQKIREAAFQRGIIPQDFLDYMDTKRAQAQGSKLPMPSHIDEAAMEGLRTDPVFAENHQRIYDLHADTASMKDKLVQPYDPFYMPRTLMASPFVELPNGTPAGGGIANTGAGSNRERSFMALEDVAGGRTVVDDHGNRVYAYHQGQDPTVYRKSNLGLEAQPVISRMVSSLADVVGFRDQEMGAELRRMESELNFRMKDYEAATTKLEDAQTNDPTNTAEIDRLMQNQEEAAKLHSESMDTLEEKLQRIQQDKLRDPKALVANDPRAADALQRWNGAAGEFEQLRRNFGQGPDWARQKVYRQVGTGSRDWSENLSKMTQATTQELHDQLPGVKYRTDPFLNLAQTGVEQRGANAGTSALHQLRTNKNFASPLDGQTPVPQGWVEPSREVLARAPMLGDGSGSAKYALEPRVASLLESMAKGRSEPGLWKRVGDFFLNLGFVNPLVHPNNLVVHGLETAGIGAFTPEGSADFAKHLEQARLSLEAGDNNNRMFLENGGVQMTRKTLNQNWERLFSPEANGGIDQRDINTRNKKGSTPFGEGNGPEVARSNRPDLSDYARMLIPDPLTRDPITDKMESTAFQDHPVSSLLEMPISSMNKEMTWKLDDQFRLGLTTKYIADHGLDLNSPAAWREAIAHTDAGYPSYKNSMFRFEGDNPVSNAVNQGLHAAVDSPNLAFARFKTDSMSAVLHSLNPTNPENLSHLAALAAIMGIGKGVISPVIKTLTDNDKAEWRGGGPIPILDHALKFGQSPSPQTGLEWLRSEAILHPGFQMLANALSRKSAAGDSTNWWGMKNEDGKDLKDTAGAIAHNAVQDVLSPLMFGQDLVGSAQGTKSPGEAAAMQLLGGTTNRTPMEARLNMVQRTMLPPDDSSEEGMAKLLAKQGVAALVKQGNVTELRKKLLAGELTDKQFDQIIDATGQTREEKLASKLSKFTMDKANPIFNAANREEFNAALPMMFQKAGDVMDKGGDLAQVKAFFRTTIKRVEAGDLSPKSNITVDALKRMLAEAESHKSGFAPVPGSTAEENPDGSEASGYVE